MLRNPNNNSENSLENTLESVNQTGLKHFILNCLLKWLDIASTHVALFSTFPPLCSSHSPRAAAVTHPPLTCLISSYFPDKCFGYAQVLILPAVPICLLSASSLIKAPTENLSAAKCKNIPPA